MKWDHVGYHDADWSFAGFRPGEAIYSNDKIQQAFIRGPLFRRYIDYSAFKRSAAVRVLDHDRNALYRFAGNLRRWLVPTKSDKSLREVYTAGSFIPPSYSDRLRVEMITTCVGWAKSLDVCLTQNLRHFDHVIVITDFDDVETQAICRKHDCSFVMTNEFYHDNVIFDKGTCYNSALKHLKYREFVAFIDCDIVLDRTFRAFLGESQTLDVDALYGCDRIDVKTQSPIWDVTLPISSATEWGFGYFQLCNLRSKWLAGKSPVYPASPNAHQSDFLFRDQFGEGNNFLWLGVWTWDANAQKRLDLPCFHLVSEVAQNRADKDVEHYVPAEAKRMLSIREEDLRKLLAG